jgi:hypothetical protein
MDSVSVTFNADFVFFFWEKLPITGLLLYSSGLKLPARADEVFQQGRGFVENEAKFCPVTGLSRT